MLVRLGVGLGEGIEIEKCGCGLVANLQQWWEYIRHRVRPSLFCRSGAMEARLAKMPKPRDIADRSGGFSRPQPPSLPIHTFESHRWEAKMTQNKCQNCPKYFNSEGELETHTSNRQVSVHKLCHARIALTPLQAQIARAVERVKACQVRIFTICDFDMLKRFQSQLDDSIRVLFLCLNHEGFGDDESAVGVGESVGNDKPTTGGGGSVGGDSSVHGDEQNFNNHDVSQVKTGTMCPEPDCEGGPFDQKGLQRHYGQRTSVGLNSHTYTVVLTEIQMSNAMRSVLSAGNLWFWYRKSKGMLVSVQLLQNKGELLRPATRSRQPRSAGRNCPS